YRHRGRAPAGPPPEGSGRPGRWPTRPGGKPMNALPSRPPTITFLLALVLVALSAPGARPEAARDVARMAEAAADWVASLDASQREAATFGFDDEERLRFHFIPVDSFPRSGLRLRDMTDAQRE